MTKFDQAVVVEALRSLEPQISTFRACWRELHRATGSGQLGPATAATRNLSAAQASLTRTIWTLRTHVKALDSEIPGKTATVPELALRAGLHVVLICTRQLEELLRHYVALPIGERPTAVRVARGNEVVRIVRDSLSGIADVWTRHGCPIDASALEVASQVIRDLGDDPDLARNLRELASSDGGDIMSVASAQILTVVCLGLEPAHSMPRTAVRARALLA